MLFLWFIHEQSLLSKVQKASEFDVFSKGLLGMILKSRNIVDAQLMNVRC